ncbi:hypothetical protein Tco_0313741 [Tanacetum coccineum]
MTGALLEDTVKNPKLNVNSTSLASSACSYPIEDPQHMEKDPTCTLLVGRGFLATTSAVIDCKKAKIAVREGVTRSIFGVKKIGLGARPPYYLEKDFMKDHLPKELEIAKDAELNPFKDVTMFRKMIISLPPVKIPPYPPIVFPLPYTQTLQPFERPLLIVIPRCSAKVVEVLILYQAYDNLYTMTEFEKHWKEIHVTWAQLEKKRDKDTTLHDLDGALDLQGMETASRFLSTSSKLEGDDITILSDAVTVFDLNNPIKNSAEGVWSVFWSYMKSMRVDRPWLEGYQSRRDSSVSSSGSLNLECAVQPDGRIREAIPHDATANIIFPSERRVLMIVFHRKFLPVPPLNHSFRALVLLDCNFSLPLAICWLIDQGVLEGALSLEGLVTSQWVFSIWKAFGGNTRGLGSFGEETDKTTDLHQHLSRISTQKLETASQITRDAVTTHTKTASQDLKTASECTTHPLSTIFYS